MPVDTLSRKTSYSYDTMGNLLGITRLSGTAEAVTTSFTYEPTFNQLASVTDPLNHTTSLGYDLQGNLTTITDPLTHQTTLTYNSAGHPISVTDALQHTAQLAYDSGDLATVTDPLGRSVTRFTDSAGRLASLTNPLGRTVRYEYDGLDQLTRLTDPLQGVTALSYDPIGRLLSVTDARNNTTNYIYDNMARVATRRDPLTRDATYLYDNNGNLRQTADRKSQVTNYTYDGLERLTQVTYADTSTTSYTYDAGNRLTQVVDSDSGTITWTYDNLDRVTSETTSQGAVSYTYDAAGRRTSMTVLGQPAVTYTYDNADRLTGITQSTSTVTVAYDSADRRTSLTHPSGVIVEYGYDQASQLTSMNFKLGPTVLGNLTYEYDQSGNRIKTGGSFARSGLPQALSSATYNAANQITQWSATSPTHDANGNVTSDGPNTYGWNARDQLASISGSIGASFQYDGLGRRAGKTINGQSTQFLYDGLQAVQELSGGVPVTNLLTGLGIDEVLTRNDSGATRTLISDGLGSTLALLDSGGTAQTQYTYEPFGKTTITGTANANSSQYTGRENDGTGLYYYRARYYSFTLQRFVSEDPIEFAAGDVNLYAYVGNNPINLVDPGGLHKGDKTYGIKDRNFWDWFHRDDKPKYKGPKPTKEEVMQGKELWDRMQAEGGRGTRGGKGRGRIQRGGVRGGATSPGMGWTVVLTLLADAINQVWDPPSVLAPSEDVGGNGGTPPPPGGPRNPPNGPEDPPDGPRDPPSPPRPPTPPKEPKPPGRG